MNTGGGCERALYIISDTFCVFYHFFTFRPGQGLPRTDSAGGRNTGGGQRLNTGGGASSGRAQPHVFRVTPRVLADHEVSCSSSSSIRSSSRGSGRSNKRRRRKRRRGGEGEVW